MSDLSLVRPSNRTELEKDSRAVGGRCWFGRELRQFVTESASTSLENALTKSRRFEADEASKLDVSPRSKTVDPASLLERVKTLRIPRGSSAYER